MSDSSTIVKNKSVPFIPNDLILNIFIKLDVRDIARCRCVCRRFNVLTLDEDFVNLHVSSSAPMIFAELTEQGQDGKFEKETHFLLDKWWDQFSDIVPKIGSFSKHLVKANHNGFLFFQQRRVLTILNPINNKKVTVLLPEEPSNHMASILGIFLHPVLKEYCTIWYTIDRTLEIPQVKYKILNLENNPCWREIGEIYPASAVNSSPVILGDFLFWMVQSYEHVDNLHNLHLVIMALDIRKEELSMVPLPHDCPTLRPGLSDRTLHSIDGFLSIIYMKPRSRMIRVKIWTPKDHEKKWWTRSDYILNYFEHLESPTFEAISYANKELVFALSGLDENRRTRITNFVGSLENGTVRKLVCSPKHGKQRFLSVFSHTPSLATLKKCKPVIRLDQENTK